MKKLVVILVAALVLGGGGYIGWLQYFADGSGEGAGGGSAPVGDQALFVELDPLSAGHSRGDSAITAGLRISSISGIFRASFSAAGATGARPGADRAETGAFRVRV